MNDPRGSYWRRWDLHVHSPYSELNNGFGLDFDTYAKELLVKAKDYGIACVGITDYFLIDGYKRLIELINDDSRLNALTQSTICRLRQTATRLAEHRISLLYDCTTCRY